jgi:hypothetical protein
MLLTALLTGCGEDAAKQQAAYQEALDVAARERQQLTNIRNEQQRVFGEYKVHDFEGRLWAGEVAPRREFGFLIGEDEYGNTSSLVGYLYKKLPVPWPFQLERLITDRSNVLPWYDRTAGAIYRRKVDERYRHLLNELRDRLSLQVSRVRDAEQYAELLKPPEK